MTVGVGEQVSGGRWPAGFWWFLGVGALAQVCLGWPVRDLPHPGWAVAGTATFVLAVAAALIGIRTGRRALVGTVAPFLALPMVAMWRQADGGASSPLVAAFAVPVLWLAFEGSRREVWAAVGLVALLTAAPVLVGDPGDYPVGSTVREAVLWTALAVLLGPLTQALVARALTSLASQRELHRTVLEHLPGTVVGILDADLRWVSISGQFAHEGIALEDLLGTVVGETLDTEVSEATQAFFRSAFEGPAHMETEARPGLWFEVDVVPFQDEHGDTTLLTVSRDVSARHRADEERQELLEAAVAGEQSFRLIFEHAPIGKVVLGLEGPDLGVLLQANPSFAGLLGVEDHEIVGTRLVDWLWEPGEATAVELLTAEVPREVDVKLRHSSGQGVWVRATRSVVSMDHRRVAIAQLIDITDRKAAERALLDALQQQREAANSLRVAEAVRTDVISTISHELRTPLTSIAGYVELLLGGSGGDLSPKQRRMLDVVDRNAARLSHLVDDLLLLSRLEEEEQAIGAEWEMVDLRSVVRQSVSAMEPLARSRSQNLAVAEIGAPVWVRGNVDQLDRALLNVISNAIKYTDEGGQILIGIEVDQDAGFADLWISDNGIGVPVEETGRLFTRFFRSSTAVRAGAEGSGLGLAIVKSLIELHGGKVSVVSDKGQGSTFVLTLPLAPADGQTGKADPAIA